MVRKPYLANKDVFVESPDGADSVCINMRYFVSVIPGKLSVDNLSPGYPDEYIYRLKEMHIIGLRPSWLTDDMLRRIKDKYAVQIHSEPVVN